MRTTRAALQAMKETNYLLSSPANAARLLESIAQDQKGEYIEMGKIDTRGFEKKQGEKKQLIKSDSFSFRPVQPTNVFDTRGRSASEKHTTCE